MRSYKYLFYSIFIILTLGTFKTSAIAQSVQTCVKPFTIPDKWIENSVPPNNTFTSVDKHGIRLPNPDGYFSGPNGTGYNAVNDKGLQLVLNASEGNGIAASSYYPVALPDSAAGGSDYRANISTCNTAAISVDSLFTAEPGNKTGPTIQGVQVLIGLDPDAIWDEATKSVVHSNSPVSPRILVTPLFDPADYEQGLQNGRNTEFKVAKFIGLFVEAIRPEGILVRITPIGSGSICGDGVCDNQMGENCGNCPADCPAPPNTICL